MFKLVDELFVAVRHDNKAWLMENGDTKALTKRKDKMKNWAGANSTNTSHQGTHRLMNNTPSTGFKFQGFVSRYSTDSKLFEIKDPRGFVVELNCGNVSKLLELCTIVNGVIQEELVYVKDGNNFYLTTPTSQEYLDAQKAVEENGKQMFIPVSKLNVGDIVVGKDKREYQYLGQYKTTWHITVTERQSVTFGRAINTKEEPVFDEAVDGTYADVFRNMKSNHRYDRFCGSIRVVKVLRNEPAQLMTEDEQKEEFTYPTGRVYNVIQRARTGMRHANVENKLLKVEHKIPKRRQSKEKKDANTTTE